MVGKIWLCGANCRYQRSQFSGRIRQEWSLRTPQVLYVGGPFCFKRHCFISFLCMLVLPMSLWKFEDVKFSVEGNKLVFCSKSNVIMTFKMQTLGRSTRSLLLLSICISDRLEEFYNLTAVKLSGKISVVKRQTEFTQS